MRILEFSELISFDDYIIYLTNSFKEPIVKNNMPKTLEELREELSVDLEGGRLRADFYVDSDNGIDVWYLPNDEIENKISAISQSHRRRLLEGAHVLGLIYGDPLCIKIGGGKDITRKYTCETYCEDAFGEATKIVMSAISYFERVMKDANFRKVSKSYFGID